METIFHQSLPWVNSAAAAALPSAVIGATVGWMIALFGGLWWADGQEARETFWRAGLIVVGFGLVVLGAEGHRWWVSDAGWVWVIESVLLGHRGGTLA
ncbi:hypothetical protein TPY_2757 [Sulfobacillus acidophilus TPY]|uniref:Uncharacterized protein n=1 Tax=Sulfobacillus acidophilus (strain ATCC 700253 / DSM 10332 / NAL) TaxID=679936 RepID=G8TUH4_SULAD|nr:hypothetical protein TPY_2757 [Sulfobacillus acidophilus TPY]AEW04621.1 hypothetical protein Sulac_1121 [Sulfobacillus acidophilus DSM 10332]